MYIDFTVAFGIGIVVATCAFVGYCVYFGYKHIKQDVEANEKLS